MRCDETEIETSAVCINVLVQISDRWVLAEQKYGLSESRMHAMLDMQTTITQT